MGNQPTTSKKEASAHKNQLEILNQAGKLAQQLRLFQSQNELREHRHLFARIMVYGHSNIIEHLKKFDREKQKQIIRDLKLIDYQTTDLLYQNLVLKKMRDQKNDTIYQLYQNFLDKSKERTQNSAKFNLIVEEGEEALSQKKVAILLFAGGESTRFRDKDGQTLQKQLYVEKPGQKCLLEIALDKISAKKAKYEGLSIYLVHNERNHTRVNNILTKYSHLSIKKLLQHENPIVNLSGKLCIKSEDKLEIMMLPRGSGDLANLSVRGTKLIQEMQATEIQYVCALGIENICADVCDPYMIGLLVANPTIGVSFKCTYPNNQDENLKRVVINKAKKCLQAAELEALLESADKKCESIIKRSPVWMNNAVFKLKQLKEYLQKKRKNSNACQVFTTKKTQCTYWNPTSSSYCKNQHCYFFERELNDLLLNEDLKSIGVMVEREHEFAPVVSLYDEQTWEDAYNQYQYYLMNDKKQIKTENFFSFVNFTERSEM